MQLPLLTVCRNLIERFNPERVLERRQEMEGNPDYQKNLDKFEKELQQKKTGVSHAQRNAGFFAGIAVAMSAVAVGLI